jgi:methionine sulfoxide reductase heme-binding subunit
MTESTVFWYASRATGLVTLLLFTAVLVLGLLVTSKGRLPGLPGFAVTSLHRNLSLLGLGFVVAHVLTAVLDSYVSIPLVSAVIPFASGYERFWLGLGAVALDLIIAISLTSLVRGRLPRRWWRPVHLLAYLSWPVAFTHCLGASKDLRQGWLFDIAAGCAVLVAAATVWRLAAARQPPRAARVMAVFAEHAENSRGPGGAVREPTSRRPAP